MQIMREFPGFRWSGSLSLAYLGPVVFVDRDRAFRANGFVQYSVRHHFFVCLGVFSAAAGSCVPLSREILGTRYESDYLQEYIRFI